MTRGRVLVIGLLLVTLVFGVALFWFQNFAYYERQSGVGALRVAGEAVPISGYEGIDAATSPLKLRGCFRADPSSFAAATPAPEATPLVAPYWFSCFDAGAITEDLAAGRAAAYALDEAGVAGFEAIVAIYPDGRGYLWRQLGPEFAG
ncbi:DUF6446 family protein [Amaricoccus sp.]|uniref:DUF6446 family protein n=1 Tax=Amaricoccus sp. TaxID=1872485 RepID=UPI001B6BB6EC|nr:DUF6446 family protein [Amaricoccus sp.]MBP7243151.1 histidine kinase [Amaricoccus sp.]